MSYVVFLAWYSPAVTAAIKDTGNLGAIGAIALFSHSAARSLCLPRSVHGHLRIQIFQDSRSRPIRGRVNPSAMPGLFWVVCMTLLDATRFSRWRCGSRSRHFPSFPSFSLLASGVVSAFAWLGSWAFRLAGTFVPWLVSGLWLVEIRWREN